MVESIKEDPEFLKARPVIVNTRTGKNVVVAGNMRVRACQSLGYTPVPAVLVDVTDEQEKRWALKDNIDQGRRDWRWTPETRPVAKTESILGAARRPRVRHGQYSEEARS